MRQPIDIIPIKCLNPGEKEIQQIDSIWETRSLRPISRSFPLLRDLTLRKLCSGEVDSRAFRFCIKRLEALARCPEFEVPDTYFVNITPLVIKALSEYPASTDELSRYLSAVPTGEDDLTRIAMHLRDSSRNYYTWQSYRLWTLLVQKGYRNSDLLSFAMEVVRSGSDDANRCGATLYSGAFGDKRIRIEIAERFPDLDSFIGQRAALLAIQELHFRPHVEDHIAPAIRNDLRNVYRGLKRRGLYVAPPEPFPITRILDMERHYD